MSHSTSLGKSESEYRSGEERVNQSTSLGIGENESEYGIHIRLSTFHGPMFPHPLSPSYLEWLP